MLGHADADHRGAAPGLGAPVYCHPAEREAAESADPLRRLLGPLQARAARPRRCSSGCCPRGTAAPSRSPARSRRATRSPASGWSSCPGHAPGLIGLFRESDRLALVSDCFYTLDPQTGIKGAARVPHPAFNIDTEQARASIRKLAALEPSVAWAGHADPVRGDVVAQLEQAAAAPQLIRGTPQPTAPTARRHERPTTSCSRRPRSTATPRATC